MCGGDWHEGRGTEGQTQDEYIYYRYISWGRRWLRLRLLPPPSGSVISQSTASSISDILFLELAMKTTRKAFHQNSFSARKIRSLVNGRTSDSLLIASVLFSRITCSPELLVVWGSLIMPPQVFSFFIPWENLVSRTPIHAYITVLACFELYSF